METYAPERQRELAAQAHRELPDSGKYTDHTNEYDQFEAAVNEDCVKIYDRYGMALREISIGKFVLRVEMGTYERTGDGRHV